MPHTQAVTGYPFAALGIALIAVAVSRWVFASHGIKRADYGLLAVAATRNSAESAQVARERLGAEGIRATVGTQPPVVLVDSAGHAVRQPSQHEVLVFPADLERAVATLSIDGDHLS